MRTRYNSLFFNCLLFYEASIFVQNLPGPHRTMEEFQAMAAVINGSEARKLRESSLYSLRNKFAFHFDVREMAKHVQKLEQPIFLTALGGANGDVYTKSQTLALLKLSGRRAAQQPTKTHTN